MSGRPERSPEWNGGLSGRDAQLRLQGRERGVNVLHGHGDVALSVAQIVGFCAVGVGRQLEPVARAAEPRVDVVGAAEVQPAARFEPQRGVETPRRLGVADADAGVGERKA